MSRRHFLSCLYVIGLFVTGVFYCVPVSAQAVDASVTQEYFIQQAADEDILIRINGFEAEFESIVSGQNNEILLRSGIPGSRIVPLFQYIDAPDSSRQLDIRVRSEHKTDRSQFGLELTRLKAWDDRSNTVSRAYRLLSFGMISSQDESAANWTVKIDSLVNAGRLFRQFGMTEMRLWSEYLAAHLIHHHLRDYSIVYSMTRDILSDLKGTRLQKLELASMQLQSASLIGLRSTGTLNVSDSEADPVQSALSKTAALAASLGFDFEQAFALNLSGIEYAAGAVYQQALEQFRLAVQIADAVGEEEFATGIRESIVEIHAIQGDTLASGEVLQRIETQLTEEGAGDELALNLLAQGRLLIRNYRYYQAAELLYQALEHENDSAIRRQINFDLAKVFYQTGRPDEALAYLQLARVDPETSQQRRGNPVINIAEGLDLLANIQRVRGEFQQMAAARMAQGRLTTRKDWYLYDKGLDEIRANPGNRQRAQSLFRESHSAAIVTGNSDLQNLSRLQFCALGGASDSFCSGSAVNSAYAVLSVGGVPRFAIEAMFLRAKIHVMNGQPVQAIGILDRAVKEIHLLRFSLPGVLGAWYWERHNELFEYYLALLAKGRESNGGSADMDSLLVLSRIRYIEKHSIDQVSAGPNPAATDQLRSQLSQREDPPREPGLSALNQRINQALADSREALVRQFEHLSKKGLQRYLRGLASDEAVLTYHISPDSAHVWVAHKGQVERRSIAQPAYVYSALQEARQGFLDIGVSAFDSKMEELGRRLVTPVADLLPETIYWIPAGPLLGLPLDALRHNGRYLVEDHSVINLLSFPLKPGPAEFLKTGPGQSMFLAGHPQEYTGEYATRLETSTEIQAIADLFIGPDLRIIQGTALLPDEFQGGDFVRSKLIHLSMPGIIDLKYSDLSSLGLSGWEDGPGRAVLRPSDIRSQDIEAELVFLSATRVQNDSSSGFSSQPGLVSDFLVAGAAAVIARVWIYQGNIDEQFASMFYRQLKRSGSIIDCLLFSKRQFIKKQRESDSYDWAGYQVYIN